MPTHPVVRADSGVVVMGEMLVVRWPQHSTELVHSLAAMRELGELLDVTLVTPDGEAEAHRVVLAASSELLRAMLKKMPTTYGPCSLMLRDLNIGQLELALDFIYRGELAVDKSQFGLLARACDYLQIKASLASEEGIAVVEQRVFEDEEEEEPEEVPYHPSAPNQAAHPAAAAAANVKRCAPSHVVAQETAQVEHMDTHTLAVPEEFQVIELVEETRSGSSGGAISTNYATRRNRQEYAKRAKLTTVGDKKILSLEQEPTAHDNDEKPIKRFCRECSLMFNYLSDYKEHRRQMHSLQCNHCNFRATKTSAVRDHFEKVHQNLRRFSCTECAFQCKDRATLYNHIRRHTNEKPYECAYCNYKAAQCASMKQHVALHENVDSRPHRCDECTRHPISFASRSALTKHKKTHHSAEKDAKTLPMVMNLEIIKDDDDDDEQTEPAEEADSKASGVVGADDSSADLADHVEQEDEAEEEEIQTLDSSIEEHPQLGARRRRLAAVTARSERSHSQAITTDSTTPQIGADNRKTTHGENVPDRDVSGARRHYADNAVVARGGPGVAPTAEDAQDEVNEDNEDDVVAAAAVVASRSRNNRKAQSQSHDSRAGQVGHSSYAGRSHRSRVDHHANIGNDDPGRKRQLGQPIGQHVQQTMTGGSVIHQPVVVVGGGAGGVEGAGCHVVTDGQDSAGLSVTPGMVGVTMVVGSGPNVGETNELTLGEPEQQHLVESRRGGVGINSQPTDSRVVMSSTTVPLQVGCSVGGQLIPMSGISATGAEHRIIPVDSCTRGDDAGSTSAVVVASAFGAGSKDSSIGNHLLNVHPSDGMQLHQMM